MFKKVINVLVGDIDEKREYMEIQKRAGMLPEEYKSAYKRIRKYVETVGLHGEKYNLDMNMAMLTGVVELFETATADGRPLIDVIGNDTSMFCDELMRAYSTDIETQGDKLNKEILERFSERGE